MHRSIPRPAVLGLSALATVVLLSGCSGAGAGAPASTSAASTAAATAAPSETTSADVPTTAASPAVSGIPIETAVPSATPSAVESSASTGRATSADGVFSVAMPAGSSQDAGTIPDSVSSITLDRTGNGNLVIASLRYSKPQITITRWFDAELDTLKSAFPSCTFPRGADVIGEKLGDKADANSRAFTCDAFPGTYTIFTANGPNGEMLAGHDQDFTGAGQAWKALVTSAQTLKKP